MKKNILVLALSFLGLSAFAQNTGKLLGSYYEVKNALVSSDSKAATKAVSGFQATVKAEPAFAQKDELAKATEKMTKTGDLEKQRAAFADVSVILWNIVKSGPSAGEDVYYQYCPMKKASWLSNESAVKNPYYGSKMLTCGSVKDKKLK